MPSIGLDWHPCLKVVYGVVREILNIIVKIVLNHFVGSGIYNLITYGKILTSNKTTYLNHKIIPYNPIISLLNVNWQMDKCSKLGIVYRQAIKQPSTLIGCKLCDYLPWQTEDIEKDGNCLFRCISKLVRVLKNTMQKSVAKYVDSS